MGLLGKKNLRSDLLKTVVKPQRPNPRRTTESIRLLKWKSQDDQELGLEFSYIMRKTRFWLGKDFQKKATLSMDFQEDILSLGKNLMNVLQEN